MFDVILDVYCVFITIRLEHGRHTLMVSTVSHHWETWIVV